MVIIWSTDAINELKNIYLFLSEKSENYAIRINQQIIESAELLQAFPNLAPIENLLEGYPHTYRSLIVMSMFKVIYYVDEETIYITNVWDCRQNPLFLIEKINP